MTFTPIIAGYYLENYLSPELAEIAGGFPMKADEEGIYTLYWPKFGGKEEIPFISIMDDFGDHVHAIFIDPERYNGKVVSALSEILSYDGLVEAFSKGTYNDSLPVVREGYANKFVFHSYWEKSTICPNGFLEGLPNLWYEATRKCQNSVRHDHCVWRVVFWLSDGR